MNNKSWKFLQPGDVIDVIAPSSTVPSENLLEYYTKIEEFFKKIGLIARIPNDLIVIDKDLFSANDLGYRAKHLIDCFNDKTSKAIWSIRGGYGAAKIIPFLEQTSPPKNTKLLLGFSDITALHLFLENKWNICSMHAPVINQLINNEQLLNELEPIIFGKKTTILYDQLIPLNDLAKKNITIKTSITGGNLSLVQTSLATSWQIQPKNKIIFLEDVGEQGYRIDRMLNHLFQAGIFSSAKALIFGEITPPKDIEPNLCAQTIENFSSKLNIPVLSLPIIGHNVKKNSPLPLGTLSELKLGDHPILSCLSGGKN